jgi:hypothetical protein
MKEDGITGRKDAQCCKDGQRCSSGGTRERERETGRRTFVRE